MCFKVRKTQVAGPDMKDIYSFAKTISGKVFQKRLTVVIPGKWDWDGKKREISFSFYNFCAVGIS